MMIPNHKLFSFANADISDQDRKAHNTMIVTGLMVLTLVLILVSTLSFTQKAFGESAAYDNSENTAITAEQDDPSTSSPQQTIEPSSYSSNVINEVASTVLATSEAWVKNGTCEWMWDSASATMTIRPIGGASSGELESLPWKSVEFWSLLYYLRFEGRVVLPDFTVYTNEGYFESLAIREIQGIENIDTSKVTDMSSMFSMCDELSSLNLSNFDTSNVKSMWGMFWCCFSLESVDLSSFDTSNVEDINGMFLGCKSLISLDLSNFNTSKVQYMGGRWNGGTFAGCESLVSLDISSFDTSSVCDMSSMFLSCKSLRSLDLSHFDTSNVEDMVWMFSGCESLLSLNVSSFDTQKVTRMLDMFASCSSLTSLDLSSFDTSNVNECVDMFAADDALARISIGARFTLQNTFPLGVWTNENGASFGSFSIPQSIAATYTRTQLVPTPYAKLIDDYQKGEINVTVGCDPFWIASGVNKSGIPNPIFYSDNTHGVTVDKYGLVTVHSAVLVEIGVSFDGGSDKKKCMIRVNAKGFPQTEDSNVKAFLAAWDSYTAKKLEGCSLRVNRSPLLNDDATLNTIKSSFAGDSRILDILDIDIIGPDGNILSWDDPEHAVWILFEEDYLGEYFSTEDTWRMVFTRIDDKGKVMNHVDAYWYRGVPELAFEPTHLSTFVVTATPNELSNGQEGQGSVTPQGSSNAKQNSSSIKGNGSLAQTGDELLLIFLLGLPVLGILVGITLISLARATERN